MVRWSRLEAQQQLSHRGCVHWARLLVRGCAVTGNETRAFLSGSAAGLQQGRCRDSDAGTTCYLLCALGVFCPCWTFRKGGCITRQSMCGRCSERGSERFPARGGLGVDCMPTLQAVQLVLCCCCCCCCSCCSWVMGTCSTSSSQQFSWVPSWRGSTGGSKAGRMQRSLRQATTTRVTGTATRRSLRCV